MEGRREVAAAGGGGRRDGPSLPGTSVPEPSRTKVEKFSDEPSRSSAPPAPEAAAATTATAIAAAARQPSSRNGAEDARKPRVESARKAPSVRSDASSRADRWLSAPVTKNR